MSLSTYKTFSPSEPVPYLKLCKDCKYYVLPLPPQEKNKKLGKCALFGTVNLIDGEVEYKFVSDVRPALCNGKYHEIKNTEL
jgi:hypothetical protein